MLLTLILQPRGLIIPLQVLVINSKRKVTKPPPPAITVFARQPNTGWRNKTSGGKDIFDKQCRDYPGQLTECIQEKTFDFDEIIKGASLYYNGRENISLMEPRNKSWSTHFTSMMFGRGYTLHFDWNSSAEYHHVYLYLNTSFKYTIFVHDPKYFLVTQNNLALPILFVTFDPKQSFNHFEQLVVTEHHLLDNCNPEPGYNFNKCIQEVKKIKVFTPNNPLGSSKLLNPFIPQNLEMSIGCNLPWSQSVEEKLHHECDTIQDYR